MSKPVKTSSNEYSYKGFTIARYENANGGTRWSVEQDGKELAFDLSRKWVAVDQIDQRFAGRAV